MNGLGQVISLQDSFNAANQGASQELQMQQALAARQTEAAAKGIMEQFGTGGMTEEDAINAMMGVNPDFAMDWRRQAKADKNAQFEQRGKALDWMEKELEGVEDDDDLAELKRRAADRWAGVEGFDPEKVLPFETYDEFKAVKPAWVNEKVALTGVAKKTQEFNELVERYGKTDPRAVAAGKELERAEQDYIRAEEEADLRMEKLRLERDALARGDKDFKFRKESRNIGNGMKQEFYSEDDGRTWKPWGTAYEASDSSSKNVTPTTITDTQIEKAGLLIDNDPDLAGVENKDLLLDAVVSRANKIAKDSEEDYVQIIRRVIDEVKATDIEPGEKKDLFGIDWLAPDKSAKYTPQGFVTEARARENKYPIAVNPKTGEKMAKIGDKWVPVK